MGYGMVFNRRCYDMFATQVSYSCCNSSIAAFSAATGKKYFGRMCIKDLCNRFSGCFNGHPAFPAIRINGGGVAKFFGKKWHHFLQHKRIKCSGGGVIEVYTVQELGI